MNNEIVKNNCSVIITHTPAPWFVEGTTKKGNPHIITAGKKGWVIAEVTNQELGGKYDLTEERSEANARLIAAAPELLEALKALKFTLSDYMSNSETANKSDYDLLDEVEKLIQKATAN